MLHFKFERALFILKSYVGLYPKADSIIGFLAGFNPIKMGPMILILWGFWFQQDIETPSRRKAVIQACMGSLLAMIIARLISLFAIFRLRPLQNPDVVLRLIEGINPADFNGWSSFPSDHAALGFALATSIFFIHRKWGILALIHTAIIICLPRMYLSLHYPTDIIAGALIGISITIVAMKTEFFNSLGSIILRIEKTQIVFFYILFILFTSQMMQMFNDIRNLGSFLVKLFKII